MLRALLLLIPFVLTACSEQETVVRIEGPTMGTSYHIAWVGMKSGADELQKVVDDRLVQINKAMSTYDPQSELSLINQGKAPVNKDGWIPVSTDLSQVLVDSIEIYRKSEGLFDISVGPLVNLWGFGPDASLDEVPSAEALQAAMDKVGLDALELNADKTAIQLKSPRYLDLSAIAKGWGVDDLAELLQSRGINNYMVEVGGEIRTGGLKADGSPWKIAIERPGSLTDGRRVELVIEPEDSAVATSGDYRNYFEQDGVRYSHTINPYTGRPITHRLASVTVVTDSSAMADGWATALNVAGPEKGMELAEKYQLAVFMIVRDEQGFSELSSSRFRKQFIKSR